MDFSKPLHIVIVGGSLASLFAAIPILRLPASHKVTIIERSPTPLLHDQGAGIVAGSETLEWFRRFDVSERGGDVEKISVLSRERLYLDREGTVIDREESRQRMTSWGVIYGIGRAGFDHGGTEDGDGRVKYAYGCRVTKLSEVDGQVRVEYAKGREDEGAEEEALMADFVIVADGPSSNMRKLLLGSEATGVGERKYAGYVAFRGTVSESELSDAARDVFVQRFTFFHGHEPNTQILAYTIPGPKGTVKEGERLVNWVWYWNVQADSKEYDELMTDSDGKKHRFTLPTGGKMQKTTWTKQLDIARLLLPPQFAEIVTKTTAPFVQAITDLVPPPPGTKFGRLLNGRAVLVGDALAGFRPHTAASTSQAAFHALLLEKVFRGEMEWDEYEHRVLEFASSWQKRGVMLGQRSQFGFHPLAAGSNSVVQGVARDDLWMKRS